MNKKSIIAISVALLVATLTLAAPTSSKVVGSPSTNQRIEVTYLSPTIVRIHKTPLDRTCQHTSFSITMKPQKTSVATVSDGDVTRLSSKQLSVALNAADGSITFSDARGNVLLRDKERGTRFKPIDDAGKPTYEVEQTFVLAPDEVVYGLGQQQHGRLNQRNQQLMLRNENMSICIPFIHSEKGYGLYWDNYSPTRFDDRPEGMTFSSEVGDCASYYFIYGGDSEGVIAGVRQLTGQMPMYPLWTLGLFQSRERYKSPEELTEVVDRYRALGVPLDGIVQDWQYWGGNDNWNAISFDNPVFADGKGEQMIDYVHKQNAHIIISVWPSFGAKSQFYHQMDSIGALLGFLSYPEDGGTRPFDVYNPVAGRMYWNRMKANLFDAGVDGWWLDATEPEIKADSPEQLKCPTALGTFRSVENAFPIYSNSYVYNGQRATSSAKRAFLLTRSSSFGQQRYASHSWSGDIEGTWDAFRKQITAGINYSMCGIPYWGTDIGGFWARHYNNDVRNVAYHELHVRWYEWGAFQPIMRSHNAGPVAVEIYQFGKRGDWEFDALEKFTRLRYRLLPYNYATAWQVTANSGSIIRPLVMDFAADRKAITTDTEYMFGKSFLVRPVTDSLYTWQDADHDGHLKTALFHAPCPTTEVYLPQGAEWYDFWTGEKSAGGRTLNREVPLDIMPIYVRAGSIVPWGPDVQYAAEKPWDNLTIRVYPGRDADFTLYEDEGDNYNYERGAYTTIPLHWDDASRTLTIGDRKGKFTGMLANRTFNVVIVRPGHGTGVEDDASHDAQVQYSGKHVSLSL